MQVYFRLFSAWKNRRQLVCVACLLLLLPSCSGDIATAVKPADIDPSDAATQMLEAHDGDGDGALSLEEAKACPSIHQRFSDHDGDGDGQLSSDEIASRFRFWQKSGVGVMAVSCLVTLDGKKLKGATVLFEPEPFFGDALKQAKGITGKNGRCYVSIDPKDLPERVRGVRPGLYRVKITHPKVSLSTGTLGEEVSDDIVRPNGIRFELKTKR